MEDSTAKAASGESSIFEIDIKAGAELMPIKYTCDPLRDDNGEIYGILHTGTPIVEIKEQQKYVQRNTDRFGEAVKQVAEGDLTVKLEKGSRMTILAG